MATYIKKETTYNVMPPERQITAYKEFLPKKLNEIPLGLTTNLQEIQGMEDTLHNTSEAQEGHSRWGASLQEESRVSTEQLNEKREKELID